MLFFPLFKLAFELRPDFDCCSNVSLVRCSSASSSAILFFASSNSFSVSLAFDSACSVSSSCSLCKYQFYKCMCTHTICICVHV